MFTFYIFLFFAGVYLTFLKQLLRYSLELFSLNTTKAFGQKFFGIRFSLKLVTTEPVCLNINGS